MEEQLDRYDKRVDIRKLPEQYAAEDEIKKRWERLQPYVTIAILVIVILAIGLANSFDQGAIGSNISEGEMSPRSMIMLAVSVVFGVTLVFLIVAIRIRRSRTRAR